MIRGLCLGVLAAALLGAVPALALPPVWTVRDADSDMLLFGSVHMLPAGLAWRPPALDAALKSADDLWLEIPTGSGSAATAAVLIAPLSHLPPGQTLDGLLSNAGRARLRRAEAAYGLPHAALQTLRPWMAEIVLSGAQAAQQGADAGGGVEQALTAEVGRPAKLMAFETLEQQAQLFAGTPPRQQAASLEQTLRELVEDPHGYEALVAAWMSGDVKALRRLAVDPLRRQSPALYRRFLTDRNSAWIVQIRQRLAGSGRTVVVVGAGHLVGPDGLPARLRALGYQVEGP